MNTPGDYEKGDSKAVNVSFQNAGVETHWWG